MAEDYVRPLSLRHYLDEGADLTAFSLIDSLVEAVVVARRLFPDQTNRRHAARNRRFVERWLSRHQGEERLPATQELLTFAMWRAECLEDTALAERFEAALPVDILAKALRMVEDRQRTHRLWVEEGLGNWMCRACRVAFEGGPAMIVTNTGEDLGHEGHLTYCVSCLSIATAALEIASGIDHVRHGIDDEHIDVWRRAGMLAGDPLAEQQVISEALLDEDILRMEASRLAAQLEACERRVATLEARRMALLDRLQPDARQGDGPG